MCKQMMLSIISTQVLTNDTKEGESQTKRLDDYLVSYAVFKTNDEEEDSKYNQKTVVSFILLPFPFENNSIISNVIFEANANAK